MDPAKAQHRAELITPEIKRLANRLLRSGQRPMIERDDLIAVGLFSLVRDIHRDSSIPDRYLLRNAKSVMLQHIRTEVNHWRKRKAWDEMFDEDGDAKF